MYYDLFEIDQLQGGDNEEKLEFMLDLAKRGELRRCPLTDDELSEIFSKFLAMSHDEIVGEFHPVPPWTDVDQLISIINKFRILIVYQLFVNKILSIIDSIALTNNHVSLPNRIYDPSYVKYVQNLSNDDLIIVIKISEIHQIPIPVYIREFAGREYNRRTHLDGNTDYELQSVYAQMALERGDMYYYRKVCRSLNFWGFVGVLAPSKYWASNIKNGIDTLEEMSNFNYWILFYNVTQKDFDVTIRSMIVYTKDFNCNKILQVHTTYQFYGVSLLKSLIYNLSQCEASFALTELYKRVLPSFEYISAYGRSYK